MTSRETPNRSHGRLAARPTAAPRPLMEDRPVAGAWAAHVVTLFPEMFPGPLGASLLGKALDGGLWSLHAHDLRRYGTGRHRKVDDTPAGGGAGLVLRPDIVGRALDTAIAEAPPGAPVIYVSPRGRPWDQGAAKALASAPGAVILCGRFEGVDQRVLDARGAMEISLGDFVMTGGEIAAYALLDSTVRLIGGVLGNEASVEEESFSNGLLEYPQYTRPAEWEGRAIPEVLLSGNHAAIDAWRRDKAERLTKDRRPDLWAAYEARNAEAELSGRETAGKPRHKGET